MYLEFHGLREKPFNQTPDPRFIFLSKSHKEAFAHLLYGINNRVGFIALTGEVGSGKTTVLRALLGQLDADHHRTALIFNPCLSALGLLQSINRELGIPADATGSSSPLDPLNQFLLKQNSEGRTVVLIIDEAQDLEPRVLEQVRLISNLETDREKLIQVVLSGQPELAEILSGKPMRQLNQRITVRYHLQPMDFEDTARYIRHRIEVAGAGERVHFSRGGLKRIYRYSGGLPRLINAACDRALLVAYTGDTSNLNSRIVAAGIRDMKRSEGLRPRSRRPILIPVFGVLAALFIAGLYLDWRGTVYPFNWQDIVARFHPVQPVEESEQTAAKEEPKKKPPITDEERFREVMADFEGVEESESARNAFNTLMRLWNAPPLPEGDHLLRPGQMETAALQRELQLYRFSGNLGAVLRMDYPAVFELKLPGVRGSRFVPLLGMQGEKLLIESPRGETKPLSFTSMERYWSGKGFLFWKDPMKILRERWSIMPGENGSRIKRLQGLLKDAGIYGKPLSGVYDDDTLATVKEFQSSKGLDQDGLVGSQTLMVLYRSIGRVGAPRLTVVQE